MPDNFAWRTARIFSPGRSGAGAWRQQANRRRRCGGEGSIASSWWWARRACPKHSPQASGDAVAKFGRVPSPSLTTAGHAWRKLY
jgi:hypothetical protein